MIPPVRIAHRGASGHGMAPENTLAAFELAIGIGVDVLEADVQVSADEELVVIHDVTLDRTTDGGGLVAEHSLRDLRRLDAGSWFDPRYRDERIPTLTELLDLARNRALVLIELKADFIAEKTITLIERLGGASGVIIQSFNPQTIARINALNPALPTALLVGRLPTTPSRVRARRLVAQLLKVGANALSIWHATLTPALFEEMRKRALSVWTWTVNEEIIMRDMVAMGVQGIITDDLDRLNQVFEELEDEGGLRPAVGRRRRGRRSRWGRRRQLRKQRSQSLRTQKLRPRGG